jgi:hypothetical protein
MNELERLTEAQEAARAAMRMRQDKIDAEAREAARAAEQDVRRRHADEMRKLTDNWREAEAARVAYLDSIVKHPLEGRRVFRTYETGYSWKRRKITERGIIRVRRANTRLPLELKAWQRPDIGEAYIQRIKADGSEGATVVKLFNKMQTEEQWRANPPGDQVKGKWQIESE